MREALKLALEALEVATTPLAKDRQEVLRAITAIKEALAQPEQEPAAMRYDFDGYGYKYIDGGSGSDWKTRIEDAEPVYTAPPKREWVGLTDEQILALSYDDNNFCIVCDDNDAILIFSRAIEAKLKEKNT